MSTGFELHVGRVERLGLGGIGRAGLISGWSETEADHVWNDGSTAVLLFAHPARPPALTLAVSGQPYLPHESYFQEVSIYVNGWWAGFWRLKANTSSTLEARIDPEWWFRRDDRNVVRISFVMPNYARPVEFGGGNDERGLAFCFRTLEFRAAT